MLIRHANSKSNSAGSALNKEAAQYANGMPLERWLSVFANKELNDSRLSAKGIEQCITAGEHAKNIDFKAIYVSPLRRTLETAYWIFKDHPNFAKMEVVMHPMLRERMNTAGDIPLKNLQFR